MRLEEGIIYSPPVGDLEYPINVRQVIREIQYKGAGKLYVNEREWPVVKMTLSSDMPLEWHKEMVNQNSFFYCGLEIIKEVEPLIPLTL